VDLKPDVATLRATTNNIQQYMQVMNDHGYVTYCRFGRDYIAHLARQALMFANNPSLTAPTR